MIKIITCAYKILIMIKIITCAHKILIMIKNNYMCLQNFDND